ncbi:MAG: DUF4212 domain-containing protein [Litorimonas sp.]
MAETEPRPAPSDADKRSYWRATKRLTIGLLIVWFAVSYGAGILFRDALDVFFIGGAPLGFWFAQNGSIYVFIILIVVYCIRMTQLETKYGIRG